MPTASMLGRLAAVDIARSYLSTPYQLGGRVKGQGVDCGTLLAEYLIEIGADPGRELEKLPRFPPDWFHHADSDRYLLLLVRHAAEVARTICRPGVDPEPGNLALFRVVRSRRFNHGAIITNWPFGIHAGRDGVVEVDLTKAKLTGFRPMDIFDPWGI